jgi:ribosomal protein L21
MEQIDYTKVKEKIVEQAYVSAQVLNEEQKRKLIQDKFERATAHYHALRASPVWHTDS